MVEIWSQVEERSFYRNILMKNNIQKHINKEIIQIWRLINFRPLWAETWLEVYTSSLNFSGVQFLSNEALKASRLLFYANNLHQTVKNNYFLRLLFSYQVNFNKLNKSTFF